MTSAEVSYFWQPNDIFKFIQARVEYKDTPAEYLYEQILISIGLQNSVSTAEAEKLWDSLLLDYKVWSQPTLELDDSQQAQWPFYTAMQNALLAIPTYSLPMADQSTDTSSLGIVQAAEMPTSLQVATTEETEAEAAQLEEAFRNGQLMTVQEVSEEETEQEIISELMIGDDASVDSEEEQDLVSMWNDHESIIDETWTEERISNFILLRASKQSDVVTYGTKSIFTVILKDLGLSEWVSVAEIKKKWSSLVKMYQQYKNGKSGHYWTFYNLMDETMKQIDESSDGVRKKTSDFTWPPDLTRKFIKLRTAKHCEIAEKGHNAVYEDILEKLGISDNVNITMARKKWNSLLKKYQDETASGEHNWLFLRDMKQVLKHFKGSNIGKLKSRASPDFMWPTELTKKFIQLRIDKHASFTNFASTQAAYISIMEQLDLGHILNPSQLRKKWNYLVAKYKELSSTVGADGKSPAPHSWPFYDDMARAMAQIPKHLLYNTKVVRNNLDNIWTKDIIIKFIQLRGLSLTDGTKKVGALFSEILEELGLTEQVTTQQARKKWNYLHTKYVEVSHPDVDEFHRKSWPYFSAMQQAVGALPFSHILTKRNGSHDIEVDDQRLFKKPRLHVCFLCNKKGKAINDYFTFEQNQKLLHTQKTVTEIICQLVGQKVTNVEATTSLCSRCTNLVNEADSVFYRNDKLKDEAHQLYKNSAMEVRLEEQEILERVCKDTETEDTVRECVVYSKRGRKRKTNILTDQIKDEPLDDDDYSKKKVRKRGRPRRLGAKIVKGLKIYHCTECEAEFKKYTDLVAHKKSSHTVIDTTELEVQETVLENGIITYFNKGKINNANTSHACRDCDKRFLRKDDLWYHQEVAHTDGKGRTKTVFKKRSYSCEECGEVFLFKYKLRMHINNKHLNDAGESANDFTCGECGCKLGSLPGLTFHMRKHHKKALTYRKGTEYLCSDCGFMATSAKKLKEHQDAHCGSSLKPKVQCEICGKTVLKVSLKMHKIKMHTDFKEQCEKCGERYATKTELLRHFNVVHLGIWVYACETCEQKFPTSDALRYHRVKAHQKATFECTSCGKHYKRVGELNAHIKRTHDGQRKVETCQYCAKEYYDRSGLRTHLINKHNVPAEMTYSENYLRKKRVEGLPLSKHLEKSSQPLLQNPMPTMHPHLITQTHIDTDNVQYVNPEEEPATALVVTEITENSSDQAVLVEPLIPQSMIHHPEVTHMQPTMAVHPHMHHPMQHAPNMRLNVLYQMNMHHPGPSHM